MNSSIGMARAERGTVARPSLAAERNHILASLSPADREAIAPVLSRVRLVQDQSLFEFGAPVEYVYFMEHGILSLTAALSENRSGMQVGMIGPEGFAGFSTVFGAGLPSMCHVSVQMPGTALRMSSVSFRSWLDRSPAFQFACFAHVRELMSQFAQNAACNGAHPLLGRCANWLLMTHQRSAGMDFLLTHEYLAMTLGVRRSGVTVALRSLRDAGVIEHGRGRIRISDWDRLNEISCGCHLLVRRNALPAQTERSCAAVEEPGPATRHTTAMDLPVAAHALFGERAPSSPG